MISKRLARSLAWSGDSPPQIGSSTMEILIAILATCFWGDPSAKDGFIQIQSIVQADDSADVASVLPADAFDPWDGEEADALRTELARQLSVAEVVKIREEKGWAVVRYRLPDDDAERELNLRLAGETWRVASSRGFPVTGSDLKQRKGRKVVKTKLTMRTENGPYVDCALSFAYATDDPEICASRMDVWFCHNGDLHGIGGSRLADLGKTKLSKIKGLPLAAEWHDEVKLQEKHAYVVHCRTRGRSDFFTVLYVKKLDEETAQLEWTLLTGGFGTPALIAEPQPVASDEPADAFDGICAKNA